MKQLTIVKIGGNVIDDEEKLSSFLTAFAAHKGNKILVHGGGKIATAIGEKLGLTSQYINGRRITDKETLNLVTMVYGGLVNKKIVAALQSKACNAIGLTGADANLLHANKRAVKDVDFGFVGDIAAVGVNNNILETLIQVGLTPVVAPLTHDGDGNMLNTNADTIAQEISKAMAGQMNVQLIYCFEKKGLLMDVTDEASVIGLIDTAKYEQLKNEGVVSGGMLPKLDNAFEAINHQVASVVIGHAEDLPLLISGTAGTKIISGK